MITFHKVKLKLKASLYSAIKNCTVSTATEALATLAISVRDIKQMRLELAAES